MATKPKKSIYFFQEGKADGQSTDKNLLGGKGANLAEMCNLGLPVPPGFTITTEVCNDYYKDGKKLPEALKKDIRLAMARLEKITGYEFGSSDNPLLVSVRSGARVSMPGMMDTVLNLGLNDTSVLGLKNKTNDGRFAFDSYRRFIQMYGEVVLNVAEEHFDNIVEAARNLKNVQYDSELAEQDWQKVIVDFKSVVKTHTGHDFPQNPEEQLWGAIAAVFESWMSHRAIVYRKLYNYPEGWGTAVNVQSMVFGNMGNDCATGVAFTRDPSTGENIFYGEFLVNAQGEDVVAGIRTPQALTKKSRLTRGDEKPSMEEAMPIAYKELCRIRDLLEKHYRDMQDMEFTVQRNKLFMLQTRNGKRSTAAALKIVCDWVAEGLLTKEEALMKIEPSTLDQVLHPIIDPNAEKKIFSKGLPGSPGAASGQLVFTADDALQWADEGKTVMLARVETSPKDVHGMNAAAGIITARGGMTSHAAVVARGMGRACVVGASELSINVEQGTMTARGVTLRKGDYVAIDGSTGEVFAGKLTTIEPSISGDFGTVMTWADEVRRLNVRTNADTPEDCRTARKFGAEGIGLCRTEHMFFEPSRIRAVREMILADSEEDRRRALAKIEPMQRQDFIDIFTIMAGTPVTIRLLDPPLHEFLPKEPADCQELADSLGLSVERIQKRVEELHESNPMLGHRGCRLLNSYPEICEMQARAIFSAAAAVFANTKKLVACEVMIPLVGLELELTKLADIIDREAAIVMQQQGIKLSYKIGTMIELPRAALIAGEIAKRAEFFSFGTNDLTQTTFGLSRDDSSNFLDHYEQKGILEHDPFATLDTIGVGELMQIAKERGRKTRKDLKLGICGEHGGDPASIIFCHAIGLDYVSCSPYRVPIARLTAARAVIAEKMAKRDGKNVRLKK
ncbi:MAG: pyruvate, phosphate dikinase [Hydrotalea sp.]|nr:pyruvate, phosphate dikinase [Hydrotalea sp.]